MAKHTKKAHRRKTSRKGRKAAKKHSRRHMRGGWLQLNPADLADSSMLTPSKEMLAQGQDFAKIHAAQHGGMAPVGYTGMLDDSLRQQARVTPIDQSMQEIAGMSDQSGGRRRGRKGRKASRKGRKASRKSRKASRKSRKASRKSRKASRKSRKSRKASRKSRRSHRGGFRELGSAPVDAPGLILPADLEAKAMGSMNPEWKLAEDPASFAPQA